MNFPWKPSNEIKPACPVYNDPRCARRAEHEEYYRVLRVSYFKIKRGKVESMSLTKKVFYIYNKLSKVILII